MQSKEKVRFSSRKNIIVATRGEVFLNCISTIIYANRMRYSTFPDKTLRTIHRGAKYPDGDTN